MLWTYHEFRRAHPETDTSEAVAVAGFQILKMGEVDEAVELLRLNAAAYPSDASAHFGLGRALERAKRVDEARREYVRALAIDPEHRRAKDALDALGDGAAEDPE